MSSALLYIKAFHEGVTHQRVLGSIIETLRDDGADALPASLTGLLDEIQRLRTKR